MAKKAALEQFHRDAISTVADKFFNEKGIEKTTMEDIAKEAEYSKATLYVYFKSKDEIFHYIILKVMRAFHDKFTRVLRGKDGAVGQYMSICEVLAEFYDKSPLYFQGMLKTLASDLESREKSEILEAIYQTGEKLNDDTEILLQKGVQEGVFKDDLPCLPTGLTYWAAISGIISFAGEKQEYISQRTGMKKKEFMEFGFQMLLRSIIKGDVSIE